MNKIRREFWNFLYAQGFLNSINDEVISLAVKKVDSEVLNGKRVEIRKSSFIIGANHSNDVALIMVLAEQLGLKQGVDWDYGLESDKYHFEIAFKNNEAVKRLLRFSDLYNELSLVFQFVSMKVSEENVDSHVLHGLFKTELEKLHSRFSPFIMKHERGK